LPGGCLDLGHLARRIAEHYPYHRPISKDASRLRERFIYVN